ncbi:hypothetical protein [Streptomyces sp. NPDC023588]|uniref:hypothetical protein n=1 Tax=Streptomyces sp. NPDC023588 TaxID=3154907 RepID=UPI0033E50549
MAATDSFASRRRRATVSCEYRLTGQCGCDLEHEEQRGLEAEEEDAQVDYRLGDARDLEWIGGGLADVGLVAGQSVDKDQARLLMDGPHPLTGELLVTPKVAVDPRGKVQARPLAEAIEAAAAAEEAGGVDAVGGLAVAVLAGHRVRGPALHRAERFAGHLEERAAQFFGHLFTRRVPRRRL